MTTVTGYADACPECAGAVDPDSHVYNPETGVKYCSGECWAEGVLA